MIMLKIKGIYKSDGPIILDKGKFLKWNDINDGIPPDLPSSINVELTLSFKGNDLLLGSDGIVWATFDLQQAEIIQSSLMAQHISSEIESVQFTDKKLFTLRITNENDINDAIDFIWQSRGGLRLKPDWVYPEGEKNLSFEQWLSEQ